MAPRHQEIFKLNYPVAFDWIRIKKFMKHKPLNENNPLFIIQ